jgi:hypothetical protein
MNENETNISKKNSIVFQLPPGFSPTVRVNLPTTVPIKKIRVSLEGKEGSIVDARNYRGNGHWEWDQQDPLGSGKYTGFIYVIKDLINAKLYLGKKQFLGAGKLNKGVQSNWQWYISSSKELSESIKLNGKDSFRFIAIEQYKSKGALSYAETWSLLHAQTPVYRHKWYNVLINKISWKVTEPPTDRHRDRLHAIMDETCAPYEGSKEIEL